MALDEVLIGDNVRVTATLRYTNEDGELVAFDPDSVTVTIKDSDDNFILDENNTPIDEMPAEYLGDDIYSKDFVINKTGLHTVIFTVEFSDAPSIQVVQKLYASSITETYKPTVTLRDDEIIAFGTEIAPLYIDPESIQIIFPDATLLEIGEIIYNYSLEVKSLLKLDDTVSGSSLIFTVLEYIKAATACELSRTYSYGSDDEVAIRLGDFSIQNRTIPKSTVSRDNASSWCQIAAALRKEMLAVKSRGVVIQPKGLPTEKSPTPLGQENVISRDPIPSRKFKRYE